MTEEVEKIALMSGEEDQGSKPTSARGAVGRLGSSKNLAGSKGNLMTASRQLGSSSNLLGRKSQSQTLKRDSVTAPPPAPAANAIIYENTYKMKPDSKFGAGKVTAIIKSTLQKILNGKKYEYETVQGLITSISDEILAEVKKLGYDRYKIVVQVDIGEFKGQGIKLASRCVWDTTTDTWASGSFKNATLYAVAMVFGCYFE